MRSASLPALPGRERALRGAVVLGVTVGFCGLVLSASSTPGVAPTPPPPPPPRTQRPKRQPALLRYEPPRKSQAETAAQYSGAAELRPGLALRRSGPVCSGGGCRGQGAPEQDGWRDGSAGSPPVLSWWGSKLLGWMESGGSKDSDMRPLPLGETPAVALVRGLSDSTATFWARNPWGAVRVHVKRDGTWQTTDIPRAGAATDFTSVMQVDGLRAAAEHPYAIDLEVNGSWRAHYDASFTTFPAPGTPSNFSFGFGSCIDPNTKGPTRSGRSLGLLSRWDPELAFFAFVGDYIYFWDHLPHTTPEYWGFYRRRAAAALVIGAQRAAPWFMQYDDHEVHNDFVPHNPVHAPWQKPAMAAWDAYAASANPKSPTPGGRWYTVTHGNAEFFYVDTRTHKVPTADLTGTLLGPDQLNDLITWLRTRCRRSRLAWCFLVSPVIFTHGSYRRDLWYGHMAEQAKVRAVMTEEGSCPVTILSGDSHIAGAWEVDPGVIEYTCSPVDAFGLSTYPERLPPKYRPPDRSRRRRRGPPEEEPYWAPLGMLPPPTPLFQSRPSHLGPAGYNCLVRVETARAGRGGRVSLSYDVVDGHEVPPRLLWSHSQHYTSTPDE